MAAAYLFQKCGDYEKRQFLFSLYDSSASHQLTEENLKAMFMDANVLVYVHDAITVDEIQKRLQAANEALDNMVCFVFCVLCFKLSSCSFIGVLCLPGFRFS